MASGTEWWINSRVALDETWECVAWWKWPWDDYDGRVRRVFRRRKEVAVSKELLIDLGEWRVAVELELGRKTLPAFSYDEKVVEAAHRVHLAAIRQLTATVLEQVKLLESALTKEWE